ncbi:MAG: 5-oxoprolinase/urea amidolyase family protein [Candidatus Microbacterium phytovorans]|uniref:5-oxoprolinase/urea amidolyase family protein n=1 Tax=Candidatus Microbacterium phytovorans TaxID=3121374 RepID=A0AAJ5W1J3_9MICO|nr:5-oxoprolinase/urea amidolyase family protein [Microbacterium sp.]WEK13538.1 MAG: 5-oxoprolinase/urea amidolyase family protein [Microbacterium sp.]
MVTPTLHPFGEAAVLAEVGSLEAVLDLHRRLTASRPPGVVDVVPAARTVLVRVDPRVLMVGAARAWISAAAEAERGTDAVAPPPEVEVPIRYDGADLAGVAAAIGLAPEQLAARHADALWNVAFTGFAPGFGYLVSEDWPFDVPRLATPRTRVPAGAVGLAAEFSGAYPRETPGGWQLIGTTSATLFDPDAAQPALLSPGARVRFRRMREQLSTAGPAAPRTAVPPQPAVPPRPTAATPAVRIVEPGLRATVQDQGRPGHASEGVSPSGAADRAALRTALRLVGTDEGAAGIEVTMGGLRAVALTDLWFAVAGAWGPIRIDGRDVDPYAAQRWPAGAELHLDLFARGVRAYVAIRGGLEAPRAVGSRSTDTLAGLGPAPLRTGDELALATDAVAPVPPADVLPWGPPDDDVIEVEVAPGPRADWFDEASRTALFTTVWSVSGDADRVGIRLDGPVLQRTRPGELPSEGMLPGAIQVPPSGRPVILGPDGPVTGGYPVVAVVTDATRDRLAQARPGTRVRFRHAR